MQQTCLILLKRMMGEALVGVTKSNCLIELGKEISSRNQVSSTLWVKITAEYFPSSKNVAADWKLRNSKDHSQWKPLSQLF